MKKWGGQWVDSWKVKYSWKESQSTKYTQIAHSPPYTSQWNLVRESTCIWQHVRENKCTIQGKNNDSMMLTWRDCTLPLQRTQRASVGLWQAQKQTVKNKVHMSVRTWKSSLLGANTHTHTPVKPECQLAKNHAQEIKSSLFTHTHSVKNTRVCVCVCLNACVRILLHRRQNQTPICHWLVEPV